jgi:hypothetical protein
MNNKLNNKAIDEAITSFTTNRDKLRDQAHVIAMMIFYHAAPAAISDECNGTGDCTRLPSFVAALPRGWADLMKTWFTAYTPIRLSSDGKNAGYDKKYQKLTPEQKLDWWKLEDANVSTFDTLSDDNGNGIRILDFDGMVKMVHQLAKRIEVAASDEANRTVVKPEDVLTAHAIASALNGLKFERVAAEQAPANEDDKGAGEQPVSRRGRPRKAA